MEHVDKFVADTNSSTKNEQLILSLKSHALKRSLAKEIAIKYKESANLYSDFKKTTDQFVVKRWAKKFNTSVQTAAAVKSTNPEDSKATSEASQKSTQDTTTVAQ